MKLTLERKAALIAAAMVVATPFVAIAAVWLSARHPLLWAGLIGLGALGGLWWLLYGAVRSSLVLREMRRAAKSDTGDR